VSHAALPSALADADGDGWQLYFSTRDERKRSSIARIPVRVVGERLELAGTAELVLAPGRLGAFDDSGVTHSCVVRHDDLLYLYYSGWSLGVTVPFYFYGGCAVSSDGGRTFERVHEAPILERDAIDPFLTASPWVIDDEGRWRMWYVSCTGWTPEQDGSRHRYHLKEAESDDGLAWRRAGTVAIDFATPDEYAIARPCVVREEGRYRMWFCARGDAYRLGYAESADGTTWTRADERVEVPRSAWDSEMQAYPTLLAVPGGPRFLLYNGDGYGRTGIGYAVAR
jgi:hypothetical protein